MTRIYLTLTDPDAPTRETIAEPCASCGRSHPALWVITRAPAGTFGHFTVYRINGEREIPDMSLPHQVATLPRDARRLDPAVAAAVWHDDNESHVFGGPNIARALRAAIAAF